MGDLYMYADGETFGLTFCTPLTYKGEFYAALCYDIKITQQTIQFQNQEVQDNQLQSKPIILQRSDEQFVQFLEVVALGLLEDEG